jgi:hypothetical protein
MDQHDGKVGGNQSNLRKEQCNIEIQELWKRTLLIGIALYD